VEIRIDDPQWCVGSAFLWSLQIVLNKYVGGWMLVIRRGVIATYRRCLLIIVKDAGGVFDNRQRLIWWTSRDCSWRN